MPGQLPQHDHAADSHAALVDGWHELSVANPTFLLERLGSECTDLQYLRELTVNGLDAIAAFGDRAVGRVVWDLAERRNLANALRGQRAVLTKTLLDLLTAIGAAAIWQARP